MLMAGPVCQAASISIPSVLTVRDAGQLRHFELDAGRRPAVGLVGAGPGSSNESGPVYHERGFAGDPAARRTLTRNVAAKLAPESDAVALGARAGAMGVQPVKGLAGWHLFQTHEAAEAPGLAERLRALPEVTQADVLLARQKQTKWVPDDPFFPEQWHLINTNVPVTGVAVDLNITNVWDAWRGSNVVIGIVDDGVQHVHPDLAAGYIPQLSWDFNGDDPDPAPDPKDWHGTAVAGIAVARADNCLGGVGVAFEAGLSGLRLLGDFTTEVQDSSAMLFSNAWIHIKNNSWGAWDKGPDYLEGPGSMFVSALQQSVASGRNGQGTVFVFPAGNGGEVGENANNDGYANNVYVACVGGVDFQGMPCSFSETGACLVASAPSGNGPNTCDGGSPRIITTDLMENMGYNKTGAVCELCDLDYTRNFSGTSASVPQVSGVAALLLQANPGLGWRDVKEILLRSGTKVGVLDASWTTNAAGIAHHYAFGGGVVNAGAAVELATNWFNLNAMQSFVLETNELGAWGDIPDADTNGVTVTLTETNKGFRVESAALTVNITHPRRGDLAITLISPSGVESVLETPHDPSTADYSWTFTTVRNWGEETHGTWQIKVADVVSNEVGRIESLSLQFFGSSVAGLSMQMAGGGDRNLQLRCAAPGWSPQNCELLSSTNLADWILLTNYTMAHGDITNYTDALPPGTMRYYRTRVAP